MSSALSFHTHTVLSPSKAYYDALATVPKMYYGNLHTAQSLIDEQEARIAEAVKGISSHYVEVLHIYASSPDYPRQTQKRGDGYDHHRMHMINLGYRLQDPQTDAASAYFFNEEKALYMAHFTADTPVNNSRGYQAVWFDNAGHVTTFAYLNAANNVQKMALDDDLPEAVRPVAAYLNSLTAPAYRDTLDGLAAINPVLAMRR